MKARLLTELYDHALEGLPILGTPAEAAAAAPGRAAFPEAAAEKIVARYRALSAATGFVCGLPGYAAMPLTIPSNIGGVALLQLHMTAAIAVLSGRDPADPAVREACVRCVLGGGEDGPERDEVPEMLDRLATKLGERGVRFVAERGIRWVVRAGRGARSLPLLGGGLGAVFDARSTRRVGRRARHAFLAAPAREVH